MGKLKLPYANKDLGQHFLIDQKVIKAICSDFMNECEGVIEVGPGPGILTEELKSATCPFHVIEMDTRFEEYLTQFITKEQITFSDALKVELDHYLKERSLDQKKIWLVSNLPYNVSVPLTTKFITTPQIEYMTLMFQKEVALKIQMRGKKNEMGSLMALTLNYFDSDILCHVPPGAFLPPPKVESLVLSLKRKKDPVIPLSDFTRYEKFLRILFSNKRKQLGKVLKSSYEQEKLEKALKECQIERTLRAETLALTQVQELFSCLAG